METTETTRHVFHDEAIREGAVMALYVSIVLIAELAGIPKAHEPHGTALLAVVWGTTLGLALAHWFAFRVVVGFQHGHEARRRNVIIGAAQLAGAAVVAAVDSLALFLPSHSEIDVATALPAFVLFASGLVSARSAGRSLTRSILYGGAIAAGGVLVALVKHELATH